MSRPSMTEHLAHRAVERTVAGRRAEYEREMARIVESTFTVIERTGTVEPSMRVILAEANLSTQAFYRYFTSKDELMLALLDEGRRRLLASLERRMMQSTEPQTRCEPGCRGPGSSLKHGSGRTHAPMGDERTAPLRAVP